VREREAEREIVERERESQIDIERIVDTEENLKPVEKSKRIVKLFKNARHALLLGLEVGKRPPHAFCLHVPVLVDRDLEHLERRRLSPQDQLAVSMQGHTRHMLVKRQLAMPLRHLILQDRIHETRLRITLGYATRLK